MDIHKAIKWLENIKLINKLDKKEHSKENINSIIKLLKQGEEFKEKSKILKKSDTLTRIIILII